MPRPSSRATKLGAVTYVGFPASSAHTLPALHKEVSARLATAARVWRWKPRNLSVHFHARGMAMGFARIAKRGADHVVSLHEKLLSQYALESIGRTIIHELCHLYREERFPRKKVTAWHDKIFCRELKRADPKVRNRDSCAFFDDVEMSPTARARQKPVWSPTAGYALVTMSRIGTLLEWVPNVAGTWYLEADELSDATMLRFLKRFKPSAWSKIPVRYASRGRSSAKNVLDLVRVAVPSSIPKTVAHVVRHVPGFRSSR